MGGLTVVHERTQHAIAFNVCYLNLSPRPYSRQAVFPVLKRSPAAIQRAGRLSNSSNTHPQNLANLLTSMHSRSSKETGSGAKLACYRTRPQEFQGTFEDQNVSTRKPSRSRKSSNAKAKMFRDKAPDIQNVLKATSASTITKVLMRTYAYMGALDVSNAADMS